MLAFLSDAWLTRAAVLLDDAEPAGVALSGRVQLTHESAESEHRWGFVLEAGRLVSISAGAMVDADVEVLQSYEDARGILFGEIDGTVALRRIRIQAKGRIGPPPPNDLSEQPELGALPLLVGATMVVQYEYSNGPFGHVSHWIEFVDGGVGGMGFGRRPQADVTVSVPYFVMALVRCGEMSILDALELGDVTGSIGPLGALAGITESAEFHRAEQATGRSGVALAAFGEIAATPSFRSAWKTLAEETDRLR